MPDQEDVTSAQALRRSLIALLVLGLVAAGAIGWLTRPGVGSPGGTGPSNPTARPPQVRFTDVTAESGVGFRHFNGAVGGKLLPETMGGGVGFFDFDNDGDADLLLVNGRSWDGSGSVTTSALYRNDTVRGGPIRFVDVTEGSGLDVASYGMGMAFGDYDGDGWVDVYITAVDGNRLFRNRGGGRFADVTVELGMGGDPGDWGTAAAWFDMDRDGDLDLFVGNYVKWSEELDRQVNPLRADGIRVQGQPWSFQGSFPKLYRNDSGPAGVRFTEVAASAGLHVRNPATGLPLAKTLAVAPIDLNDDGWMDLVVANDTVQNLVFTNRQDGTFAEVGVVSGIAFDAYGQPRGAMGIDAARFRDDDALGIAIGNFANEMNALYVSQPVRDTLLFADDAIPSGLGPASRSLLKFGLFFFDYDLDGRLDILTANGHIEEDIERIQPELRYRQPAQLFWNAGAGPVFVPVDETLAGPDLFRPMVGRGSAYADLDGDGDLDVVIAQVNGPPMILRNDQQLGHHWLRLRLVGRGGNTGAIGAWVRARVGGRVMARQVMPTRSYLSQSELTVTLGLGTATRIDGLQIRWPDGRDQVLPVPAVDREIVVRE